MDSCYDALLVVSFGGPEKREDVIPFLENVVRGRDIPRERLLQVAEHYYQFGGVSPINEKNRRLIDALAALFNDRGPNLPIYFGNRNWHPFLAESVRQMKADGIQHALALVTSAHSSYSGCRQYLDDIAAARAEVGPGSPKIDKLRVFYNHPRFIDSMIRCVTDAIALIPEERRRDARVLYTAHSIPTSMAGNCRYEEQLLESCRLVDQGLSQDAGRLVYQSRSGSPSHPWLEPDVCDYLRTLARDESTRDVVVVPIGFLSDHLEVLYDLDYAAKAVCDELGLNMVRASTVGAAPDFVEMIRELILERTEDAPARSLGTMGLSHDVCPDDCCLPPARRPKSVD